jgi:uncharacterized protein YeaO (DUF488 family)
MTIFTKRFNDPVEPEDDTRILIVRRPWIANMRKTPYDELRKELAPSETLFGIYSEIIEENDNIHAIVTYPSWSWNSSNWW